MKPIDGKEAVRRIERELPDLSAELHDDTWDGLLHLQIAVLCRRTQVAIDEGDRPLLLLICRLVVELLDSGGAEVVNALHVSFLEHLNLEDGKQRRRWAREAMPPRMRAALEEITEYDERLHRTR